MQVHLSVGTRQGRVSHGTCNNHRLFHREHQVETIGGLLNNVRSHGHHYPVVLTTPERIFNSTRQGEHLLETQVMPRNSVYFICINCCHRLDSWESLHQILACESWNGGTVIPLRA